MSRFLTLETASELLVVEKQAVLGFRVEFTSNSTLAPVLRVLDNTGVVKVGAQKTEKLEATIYIKTALGKETQETVLWSKTAPSSTTIEQIFSEQIFSVVGSGITNEKIFYDTSGKRTLDARLKASVTVKTDIYNQELLEAMLSQEALEAFAEACENEEDSNLLADAATGEQRTKLADAIRMLARLEFFTHHKPQTAIEAGEVDISGEMVMEAEEAPDTNASEIVPATSESDALYVELTEYVENVFDLIETKEVENVLSSDVATSNPAFYNEVKAKVEEFIAAF